MLRFFAATLVFALLSPILPVCADGEDPDAGSQWRAVEQPEIVPADSPEMRALRDRIRRTMAFYFHRPENNIQRSPWGVMHCILGYGVDTPLSVNRQPVNAIAWICSNAPCYNMRMLSSTGGQLNVRMGPGYQGHEGQFLSILAQSRVKMDYPLLVDGQRLKIADLIEHEKSRCQVGSELTFKLIALSHYLDSEDSWHSIYGERWDISRLIREELAQPIVGACCGGTHRLMGFTYAVRNRQQEGKPIIGQWARATAYLKDFHEYTFKLQNDDGSFSTAWFERRADVQTLDRKLNTTGHTLEWLISSLDTEQLTDPRVVQAVTYLNNLLWKYRTNRWEIGPRGHAIHALALYDERLFDGQPGKRAQQLATVAIESDSAPITPHVAENEIVDSNDESHSRFRRRRVR